MTIVKLVCHTVCSCITYPHFIPAEDISLSSAEELGALVFLFFFFQII